MIEHLIRNIAKTAGTLTVPAVFAFTGQIPLDL